MRGKDDAEHLSHLTVQKYEGVEQEFVMQDDLIRRLSAAGVAGAVGTAGAADPGSGEAPAGEGNGQSGRRGGDSEAVMKDASQSKAEIIAVLVAASCCCKIFHVKAGLVPGASVIVVQFRVARNNEFLLVNFVFSNK